MVGDTVRQAIDIPNVLDIVAKVGNLLRNVGGKLVVSAYQIDQPV